MDETGVEPVTAQTSGSSKTRRFESIAAIAPGAGVTSASRRLLGFVLLDCLRVFSRALEDGIGHALIRALQHLVDEVPRAADNVVQQRADKAERPVARPARDVPFVVARLRRGGGDFAVAGFVIAPEPAEKLRHLLRRHAAFDLVVTHVLRLEGFVL